MSTETSQLVERIVKRLRSEDLATFRAGGRAVALQAIDHRGDLVRLLRGALGELGEETLEERRRGYLDALADVLLAAEAALEPREQETRARSALAQNPSLRAALAAFIDGARTPREVADVVGKSAPMGTRYVQELRALELVTEIVAQDGRERRHRLTRLGRTLVGAAHPTDAPLIAEPLSASSEPWYALTETWNRHAVREALRRQLDQRESLTVVEVELLDVPIQFSNASTKSLALKLLEVAGPGATISRHEPRKFVVATSGKPSVELEREIVRAAQPLEVVVTPIDATEVETILREVTTEDDPGSVTVAARVVR